MQKHAPRNRISDLRGTGRLAIDAIAGITGLVEEMHVNIADRPLRHADPLTRAAIGGTTRAVYRTVHAVTRAIGGGIDLGLRAVAPAFGERASSPERELRLARLNGVLGDHLAATGNPLAITMRLRRYGQALPLERAALAVAIPDARARVVVMAHGLCMNDLQWRRGEHDHGAALARDLDCAVVYLHYNSGLHVSTNGALFSEQLEALLDQWPVPVGEIAIVAHSMGGLVARSAHAHACESALAWPRKLRHLVFLGTPHHGAPLERGGQRLDLLYGRSRYTAAFARLGKVRSAGITDLRHGLLRDEDWQGRDRFMHRGDPRKALPLPAGVRCGAIAARRGRGPSAVDAVIGDGLVPVASALGEHHDSRLSLRFDPAHRRVIDDADHFDLLDRREVYETLREWLAD